MRFCRIDLNYIKYLYQYDNRVQYNPSYSDSKNENRPYIGIVLNINSQNYFAPLEHPRPSHKNLKNNLHIFKIQKGKYGIIGLNNMIPVPKESIIDFDINNAPNRNILLQQYVFCKNHWKVIINKAEQVYIKRTNNPNSFEKKVYCDFKLLEEKCREYIQAHQQEQQPILPNQIPNTQDFSGFTQNMN
ncbi:MAG: type III toxin-antitoxin system ToxN/AbiQ family toxin [Ruminococcus sp.]